MMKTLKYLLYMTIVFFLSSCAETHKHRSEIPQAKKVQDAYRQAWLAGDNSRVMESLSDSIILFPPGKNAQKVQGKEAVRRFWFSTTGDTTYPIRVYNITDQEVFGEDEFIYFTGRSYLEFETKIRDTVQRRDTSRAEFISVYKKENGHWKIFRQMWSVK
jgi:ketosteroid isomerase-like protein